MGGLASVLHTWGSALTHHPHIQVIVLGGGLSPNGTKWVACKPGFFLHMSVQSRLFCRLFMDGLVALYQAEDLAIYGDLERLAQSDAFTTWLTPFRKSEWVVQSKPPFGGPEAVRAYLSRYTHRVAISNRRLVGADADTVAFRWRDYRFKNGDRQKIMRLAKPEVAPCFLIHVLPDGFHWNRHYALLASSARKANFTKIRKPLFVQPPDQADVQGAEPDITPLTLRGDPCASSRSFVAGRNRCHARHHGSRPHDRPPVTDHQRTLAVPCRTGPSHMRRSGTSRFPNHKSTLPGGQRLATGLESPHQQPRAKSQTDR